MERLSLSEVGSLHFQALDDKRFPAVSLARECIRAGKAASATFNIVNEIAVAAFVQGVLSFDRIVPFVAEGVERFGSQELQSLDDLRELHQTILANYQTP